jgi:hypothetical protein
MPVRRPLLAALTAGALLVTLAGCERPTPGVTLVSGGRSVHAEATQFCRGEAFLTKGDECPGTQDGVTVLRADQGAEVGVDVDRDLTETGWFLYDLDAQQSYGFQDEHYRSIVADFTNRPTPGVIRLEVRQVDHEPKDRNDVPKVLGRWQFEVVQRT